MSTNDKPKGIKVRQYGWDGEQFYESNDGDFILLKDYQSALDEIEKLKSAIEAAPPHLKCCLGSHIPGYGHSRNCRGDLANKADLITSLESTIARLTEENKRYSEIIDKLDDELQSYKEDEKYQHQCASDTGKGPR